MTSNSSIKQSKKAPISVFFSAVILIFFCSLSAADSIGFVPYYIDGTDPGSQSGDSSVALSALPQLGVTNSAQATSAPTPAGIEPVRIEIPAANIDLPVQNPATTDVDALDNLLKNGPAHYINSADLGEAGNLIIFAHSSHLPIVVNKMFQAFNNIPNLNPGDTITITGSDGKEYLYSVVSVVKANVNDGTTIDTSPSHGTNLTLVTCDTLTGVSARFVLSATFIGVNDVQ
ncbi:MAG TPA: sortase [Candidatus Paceibacterota bacterium]|nr:sortase [Candidatus Paceibacterota bacterium]